MTAEENRQNAGNGAAQTEAPQADVRGGESPQAAQASGAPDMEAELAGMREQLLATPVRSVQLYTKRGVSETRRS